LNAGTGALTFASTIDSADSVTSRALNLNTSGTTTLNGIVGGNHALTSLTTDAGGVTALNITTPNGSSSINTTGANGQVFNDAVQLEQDTVLNANTGVIDLASTLDSYSSTTHSIALNTSGVTTLNGAVGSNFALTSLTTNAGGQTNINGGVINTSGAAGQVFNDAVYLQSDTTLNASAGAINFASTIDSYNATTHSLNLNTSGLTTLNGAIGSNNALTSLATDAGGSTVINGGVINTSGTAGQVFNDAVNLQSDTTLNAGAGAINFANTIDSYNATTHSLSLNTSGVTTLNAAIGSNFALTSLTTNAGGETVINGGVINTTGSVGQVFNDAVSLQSDTILNASAGAINFANTIDSYNATTNSLNLNTSGVTTLNGAIGSNFALTSLTTDAGGRTNINGGVINTTGTAGQVFNDAVYLQSDTILNASAGVINFANTIDSYNATTHSLNLNTSGVTTLNGAIGSNFALTSLATDAGGSTIINGGVINTTGAAGQVFNDAVSLQSDTTLNASAGAINFVNTIDSLTGNGNTTHSLTLNTTGVTTLNGAIGSDFALTSLTTNAGGSTIINGGVINTTGSVGQVFNDAVQLQSDTRLNASAGAINFASTIDSYNATTHALNVNTSGITTLNGAIGSNFALTSLATDAGGQTNINGGVINTTGTAGQVFNDAVYLQSDTTLNASAGAINFANTIDSFNATTHSLALNSTGVTTLNGAIGSNHALTSLSTDVGGSTVINGGVINTSGSAGQVFNDAVTLQSDTILNAGTGLINFVNTIDSANTNTDALTLNSTGITTLNGAIGSNFALTSLTTNAGGQTNINGGVINTSGAAGQVFNDAVYLQSDTTLNASAGAINFANTIDSYNATTHSLNLNTSGLTTLNGAIGSNNALTSLATDAGGSTVINGGVINTSGTAGQVFNDAVNLQSDTILNAGAGAINFANTIDSYNATTHSLSLNTSGVTTLNAAIGSNFALTSLTTNAGGETVINGGVINTTGSVGQVFNDAVSLQSDTILNASAGAINFDNTIDSYNATTHSLNLNTSGVTTLNGAIGSNFALTSLATDAGGQTNINGGVINTTGTAGQVFNDAVYLQSDTILNASAGAINFANTIDSYNATTHSLSLNTSGVTTLNGAIGSHFALTSVATDAGGSTIINGGVINTTGAAGQVFNDAVSLQSDTTLNASAGAINFVNTIDSLTGNGNTTHSLALNTTGVTTLNGAIGSHFALTSLTTNAGGSTVINGGVINTTGSVGQVFNDAVQLQSDTTLNASAGAINFANTIDSYNVTTHALNLNTSGITTLNGAIGSNFALTSLATDAGGQTNINGVVINTTGTAGQVFNDAVYLQSDTTLNASAGAINFANTIDSYNATTHSLALNSTGVTTLNGAIGSNHALTSLSTDVGGSTVINGGVINTSGTAGQVFNDAVTLQSDTILNASAGLINFVSTIDSANGTNTDALTLNSTGVTNLNGAIGSNFALTSLTTNAGGQTNINGGVINTVGANGQVFNDAVYLKSDTTLNASAGAINFASTIDSYNATTHSLNLNTSGVTTLNGAIGSNHVLTSLATDAGGSTVINGGVINTTGAAGQVFNDAVSLQSDTTLNASAGAINFVNTIDSLTGMGNTTHSLTLNSTGVTTLNAAIGSNFALTSLTTNAGGSTFINGGVINTTGVAGQVFNDAVSLQSDTTLNASAGAINFANTIDSYNATTHSLNLNTSGLTTLNGAIGSNNALTSLATDAGGSTVINGSVINTSGTAGQVFNDAVSLQSDTTLNAGTGAINFANTIDSLTGTGNTTHALTLNTSGVTTLNSAIGSGFALTSLTTDAGGSTVINGGVINTTGAAGQVFNDAVYLQSDTTLNASAGAINFANTIDSYNATTHSLALNTTGVTTLNGAIGSHFALTSLTTNAGGSTVINGGVINTTGSVGQVFNDAVQLQSDTTLNASAGAINFASTIDSYNATTHSLNLNTSGITTLNGAIGSNFALTSVATDAGGQTNINGGVINTTGTAGQVFNDAVYLQSDTTLNASAGAINFANTIDSYNATTHSLALNSTGVTTLNGAIGSNHVLTSLSTDVGGSTVINGGVINTSGTAGQVFNDAVTLQSDTILNAGAGLINFVNTIDSANANTDALTLNSTGITTLNGAIGSNFALTSLTTNAGGQTNINGGVINTTGAIGQVFNDAVYLQSDTTLNANSGAINFANTVDSYNTTTHALSLNSSGITTLNGIVGGMHALTSLTTDAGGTTVLNINTPSGSSITTTGAAGQVFNDAVQLEQDTTLKANTGAINFANTIDSYNATTHALTLNSAGVTTLNGAIGSNFALTSLLTNAGGSTVINGGVINTTGTAGQVFNDAVYLQSDTTLNASAGAINFANSIDSYNATTHALTLNTSGVTTLNGAIGSINALTSLTTDAGGSTVINGGSITTSGTAGQVYNDTVSLQSDTTLNAGAGAINFATTIDSLNSTSHALTLNSAGITTLNGTVGGNFALTSLTTDAGGTTVLNIYTPSGSSITTTGSAGQVFNDAVQLQKSTILNANTGAINFANTIDSYSTTRALTLNTSGVTTLNGAIGSNTALTSLTTNAGGSTVINGGVINTSGAAGMAFNDAVQLQSDTIMNAGVGTINFATTIDSYNATSHALSLNSSNIITLNGLVGSNNALTSLTTGALGTTVLNINTPTSGSSITTTGAIGQVFNNVVQLEQDTTLNANTGAINFVNTLDSYSSTTHALNLNASGITTLNGAVGSNFALTSLNTNVGGSTVINGGVINTTGTAGQVFNDAVQLESDTILNAGVGAINFVNTIDSYTSTTHALNLNTSGVTTLNGAIGSNNALTSLVTNTGGSTVINGGSITTSGTAGQTYNDTVSLQSDTTMNAGVGAVTFATTVNSASATAANASALTLNSSTGSTFDGTVGATNALKSLNVNTAAIALNGYSVKTIGNQDYNGAVTLGTNNALTSTAGSITMDSTVNNAGFNLTISAAQLSAIAGVMSGSGSLVVNNTNNAILALDKSNTYTGATQVIGGILQLDADQAISAVSVTSINNNGVSATLDLNGYSETLNNITGNGYITLGSLGTNYLTIWNSTSQSFSGSISGMGNVVKSGAGTYTLSGSNSYIGTTNVAGGILSIVNSNGLGDSSSTATVQSGAQLNLSNNVNIANNLVLIGSGTNGNGALQATGNDTINNVYVSATNSNTTQIGALGGNDYLTITGLISGANLNIGNYTGAYGTVELTNPTAATNPTYTGSTNVFGGILKLDKASAINENTSMNLLNNSILEYAGAVTNVIIANLNGSGSLNINSANLTVGSSYNSLFTGNLVGDGNVTKVGSGTLTLTGVSNFTGSTLISAGIMDLASNATLGNITVASGATLELANSATSAQSVTLNGYGMNNLGALMSVGNSSLTSPVSIGAATTMNISTGTLTVNGNIDAALNSAASGLTTQGAGSIIVNGAIGAANPLSSLTTSSNAAATTTINGTGVSTLGNQVYNNPLILSAPASQSTSNSGSSNSGTLTTPAPTVYTYNMVSSGGAVTANSTIDGGVDLNIFSTGLTTFNGAVGSNTALNSLTTNATSVGINGGIVKTVGSQTYNNPVSLNADAVLTMTMDGTLTMMNGINGTTTSNPNVSLSSLTLNGYGTNMNNFSLGGGITLNNLNVNTGLGNDNISINGAVSFNNVAINGGYVPGSPNSNNTLSLFTTNAVQNWNITSANGGNIGGVANNSFTFNNIENIAAGNYTNTFALSGGTLNGTITGGNGTNTLYGDNVNNYFSLYGYNSGSATGTGGFSNIQNLVGGSANNTFTFYNNSGLNSIIGGPSLTGNGTNTLNFANYSQGLNITITSETGGNATTNGSNYMNFNNINNLTGNGSSKITISNPSKTNVIHITGSSSGYVNDPINFTGFNSIASAANTTTRIIFDTQATFNYTASTATVGQNIISLQNIQNISGNINAQTSAAQNAAIISSLSSLSSINSSSGSGSSSSGSGGVSITDNTDNGNSTSSSGSDSGSSSVSGGGKNKVSTNCS
jgi:hypothetical protein